MLRVRIRNENIWRRARNTPILRRLVRPDIQCIAAMKNSETIDLAFTDFDLLSGVSKQTNEARFADVDDLTVRTIVERSLSRIHDVGVSSGITSLELRRRLRESAFDGEVFISDKFARFWVNRHGLSTDIYDSERNLVCTYLGPIAGDRDDTWKVPLSRIAFRRALNRRFDEKIKQSFLLLHPEVMEAIERGDLCFIEFDVFENEQGTEFDFIRCMNLLNLGYFASEQLESGLKSLHDSLVTGGVLQLGRTDTETGNNVTFYEKTDSGFRGVETVGKGSEIDQLVVGV